MAESTLQKCIECGKETDCINEVCPTCSIQKPMQCDGCLGYTHKSLVQYCEECANKAAKYDITASDKRQLAIACRDALAELNKTDEPDYHIGIARGILITGLKHCEIEAAAEP